MKKVICVLLLLCGTAHADKVILVKKGNTLRATEDLQCMNNATALDLLKLVKLCEEDCEIRLRGLEALHSEDLDLADFKLKSEVRLRTELLDQKDKTLRLVEEKFMTQIAESTQDEGMWWKVTVGVVGGVIVGGAVGALAVWAVK